MRKRRQPAWDDDPFVFQSGSSSLPFPFESNVDDDLEEAPPEELLEEAHEALSKLYTRSSKRSKHVRGVRRNEAWQ